MNIGPYLKPNFLSYKCNDRCQFLFCSVPIGGLGGEIGPQFLLVGHFAATNRKPPKLLEKKSPKNLFICNRET